jgi:hypothetical protein
MLEDKTGNTVKDGALAIERVCAWCQAERGERGQAHQTHGICERHAAQVRREIAKWRVR